jgi:hypothetical protein
LQDGQWADNCEDNGFCDDDGKDGLLGVFGVIAVSDMLKMAMVGHHHHHDCNRISDL